MLKYYVNPIYNDNIDMQAIIDAIQPEVDLLTKKIEQYFSDAFPAVATLTGIRHWELVLGITPSPSTETLDFRRRRVISRLVTDIPYTERKLEQILNDIMGAGNWAYTLDYLNYALDINSMNYGSNWTPEVELILKRIVPANIKYTLHIRYNTHEALRDYTHDQLAQFTHQTIREEALA